MSDLGLSPSELAEVQAARALIVPAECVATHFCALVACGRPFVLVRPWQRHCSEPCRVRAWDLAHPRVKACGPKKRRDPAQEFARWIATGDGLTVYSEARERALRLKAAGYARYSVDALLHSIRFDRAIKLGPSADYRINDHVSSRLARLLMERVPELADFFVTRRLRKSA